MKLLLAFTSLFLLSSAQIAFAQDTQLGEATVDVKLSHRCATAGALAAEAIVAVQDDFDARMSYINKSILKRKIDTRPAELIPTKKELASALGLSQVYEQIFMTEKTPYEFQVMVGFGVAGCVQNSLASK